MGTPSDDFGLLDWPLDDQDFDSLPVCSSLDFDGFDYNQQSPAEDLLCQQPGPQEHLFISGTSGFELDLTSINLMNHIQAMDPPLETRVAITGVNSQQPPAQDLPCQQPGLQEHLFISGTSEFELDLASINLMDHIQAMDPPLEPGVAITGVDTSNSPSDSIRTPSTGSASAFSATVSDTFSLSPSQTTFPLSPLTPADQLLFSSFDLPGAPMQQPDLGFLAPPAFPAIPVNQGPPAETSTARARQQRRKRSTLPARERRKNERPEKCPICDKGHAYLADRNKHIASNHKEQAGQFNISTAKFKCQVCGEGLARKDHLLRHRRRKHGWP